MEEVLKCILIILGILLLIGLWLFLIPFLVLWSWNTLLPNYYVSYSMTHLVAIAILVGVITGSFGITVNKRD